MIRIASLVLLACTVAACPTASPEGAPQRFPTGTAPNAVVRVDCTDSPRVLVAASSDSTMNIIDINTGTTTSVGFNVGANPVDIAVVDGVSSVTGLTDPTAVVSLFDSHQLASVKVCRSTAVASTYRDDEVIVSDGTEYTPSNPQGIAVVGDDIFVAFANITRLAAPDVDMLTGPGTLLRLHTDEEGNFVRDGRLTLPCDNPAAIATRGTTLAVTCTGRYRMTSNRQFLRASDSQGAVVVIDAATFAVTDVLTLDASPMSAVFDVDDTLVVGDALDGSVSRYTTEPLALVERAQPTDVADDSIFAITIVNDTVVAAAFSGALIGAPFSSTPKLISTDAGLSRGVVDLAWLPGDADVFAVLTLSAELVRIGTDDLGAQP